MNILNLLKYSPEFGGGIAKHLNALGERAKLDGHKVYLGFPVKREWQNELSLHSEIIIIPEIRKAISVSFPKVIRKICKNYSIDVLHIHFSFALAFTLSLSKWKIPIVYHWHNPPLTLNEFLGQPKSLIGMVNRLCSRMVAKFTDTRVIDRHISISNEITNLLIENRWTKKEKITLLPNGVQSSTNIKLPYKRLENKKQIIGTVANFRPQKDHKTLIQALKILILSGIVCELWIIGDGPTRTEIETLVNKLDLGTFVRFLGTVLNPSEYFMEFDLFVLSTNYEGHPLVILEAMSFGLPIVATRISSIPEVIIHDKNGFLVNPHDPEDLARTCKEILTDKDLKKRLREAASDSFRNQLSVDDWAGQVISIYRSTLNNRLR